MREDRLAGAGLAGEHVEPGREAQLGALDQQEVLDAQFGEHVQRCTKAARRNARSRAFCACFVTEGQKDG